MTIFVDADSCPKPVREAVIRAAKRTGVSAVFAANRPIPGIAIPGITMPGTANSGIAGANITMEVCPSHEGAADDFIVLHAVQGDLVITRDIPLASRLVEHAVVVINDRGRIYTEENIREQLSIRDFVVGLANSGMDIERTSVYGKKELKQFSDGFDKTLTKLMKG
jgi:uncharacterized protein YaiI (UPF0178 family)